MVKRLVGARLIERKAENLSTRKVSRDLLEDIPEDCFKGSSSEISLSESSEDSSKRIFQAILPDRYP